MQGRLLAAGWDSFRRAASGARAASSASQSRGGARCRIGTGHALCGGGAGGKRQLRPGGAAAGEAVLHASRSRERASALARRRLGPWSAAARDSLLRFWEATRVSACPSSMHACMMHMYMYIHMLQGQQAAPEHWLHTLTRALATYITYMAVQPACRRAGSPRRGIYMQACTCLECSRG